MPHIVKVVRDVPFFKEGDPFSFAITQFLFCVAHGKF